MMAKMDRERIAKEEAKKRTYGELDKEYFFGPVNKNETGVFRIGSSNVLGNLIYYRMQNSPCRVRDAREATVFVIPMLLATKEHTDWDTKCREFQAGGMDGPRSLLRLLPHLRKDTARKHVLVNVKNMRICKKWWNSPMLEELRPITRLSVRYCYGPPCDALTENLPLFPVPYPSIVHWSQTYQGDPPWAKERSRPALMSLIMEQRTDRDSKYFQNAEKLRSALWRACLKHGSSVCIAAQPTKMKSVPAGIYTIYASSEFCLQPQGDTCERKGILDSLLLGCIPVIFNEEVCPMSKLWEFHWGEWQQRSAVILEVEDILSGKVDIRKALEAIPKAKRDMMRATIREYGHRLQYSVDEPDADHQDALSFILAGISKGARPPPPPEKRFYRKGPAAGARTPNDKSAYWER
mmetsp:Transcript_101956/g.263504  ORF Transcript_101956/g.263504 Transcript_101956/m.263504 type:complete len:408 (-) Transcript_101956:106-1329(-)